MQKSISLNTSQEFHTEVFRSLALLNTVRLCPYLYRIKNSPDSYLINFVMLPSMLPFKTLVITFMDFLSISNCNCIHRHILNLDKDQYN